MSRFLFPVGLFYQSQGDSPLEFLDSHSWKLRVAEGWKERLFRGRIRKNRKCMDLAGRKAASCRR